MPATKAEIIAQLQRDILPLQGFKPTPNGIAVDMGLGSMKYAFPNQTFPLGAIHEFCFSQAADSAATIGFIAGIIAILMQRGGAALWISSSRTVFPPALKSFGIAPDKVIFVDLQKEKDILWAMEEALKCDGLAAVVGELRDLSFTASRRLQLAVEQSRVTGFIVRRDPHSLSANACVSRWEITSLPSELPDNLPGVGFPRWNVDLLKIRNGKPGCWKLEWTGKRFRHISRVTSLPQEQRKKTG